MNDLAGKTVIITGGGAGIGQALVVGFSRLPVHVVAISRSMKGLDETRRLSQGPGTLACHAIDVRDAAALEETFRQVVQDRGAVDLLVNNAAVYPHTSFTQVEPLDWERDVGTNLNGVVYACRAAARTFPKGRPAVVLNVGSFAHRGPLPASTLYCATKAAVSAFSRAAAVDLATEGSSLIVNEWVPGIYRTQMSAYTGDEPSLAFDRLLAVWELSRQGPGGRTFEGGIEHLPPRSLKSRLKGLVLGRRA